MHAEILYRSPSTPSINCGTRDRHASAGQPHAVVCSATSTASLDSHHTMADRPNTTPITTRSRVARNSKSTGAEENAQVVLGASNQPPVPMAGANPKISRLNNKRQRQFRGGAPATLFYSAREEMLMFQWRVFVPWPPRSRRTPSLSTTLRKCRVCQDAGERARKAPFVGPRPATLGVFGQTPDCNVVEIEFLSLKFV